MRRDDCIDFFVVLPHHADIHRHLLNWSRVVRNNVNDGGGCAPIFRLYRSTDANEKEAAAPQAREPIDIHAGFDMEKRVRHLPPKNREAIRWCYVRSYAKPHSVCHRLGVSRSGLIDLIHLGRSMLNNKHHTK